MALGLGTAVAFLTLDATGFARGVDYAVNDVHKLNSYVNKTGGALETVGGKMMAAGTVLTAGLTAPIVAFGVNALKTASEFDTSMSNVKALSMATTQDVKAIGKAAKDLGVDFEKGSSDGETAFNALRATAMEMGERTKFTATESADALSYMSLAGWDAAESIAGIEGVLSLAAAGNTDLARTSDIVTDAITGFGKTASDTAKVKLKNGLTKEIGVSTRLADIMAATMANSNTTIDMLGDSFKYVTPLAGSMGYSMEDVSLALGLMANAGVKSTQSGTALRQGIKRLISPTESAAAALDKYGISAFNSDGSVRPLRSTLEDLRGAFGKLDIDVTNADGSLKTSEEIMEEYGKVLPTSDQEKLNDAVAVFGTTALPGMLAMMNATDDEFDSLAKAIDKSSDSFILYNGEVLSMTDAQKKYGKTLQGLKGDYEELGAAEAMSLIQLDNLEGDWTLFKSALDTAKISLVDIVKGGLRGFVQKLTELVRWFNSLDDSHKKMILKFAVFVAAIGPVLLAIGSVIRIIGRLKGVFGVIGKAFVGLMSKHQETALAMSEEAAANEGLQKEMSDTERQSMMLMEAIQLVSDSVQLLAGMMEELMGAFEQTAVTKDELMANFERFGGVIDETSLQVQGLTAEVDGLAGSMAGLLPGEEEAALGLETLDGTIVETDGALQTLDGVVVETEGSLATLSGETSVADAAFTGMAGTSDGLIGSMSVLNAEILDAEGNVVGLTSATEINGASQLTSSGQIATNSSSLTANTTAKKVNTKATKAGTRANKSFGKSFLAAGGPIIIIVLAIAALVAAILFLWKKSEAFRNFIQNFVDRVKHAFNQFKDSIVESFRSAGITVQSFTDVLSKVVEFILGTVVMGAIKGILYVVANIIKVISAVIQAMKGNKQAAEELGAGWKILYGIIYGVSLFIKGLIKTIIAIVQAIAGNTEALDGLNGGWKVFGAIIAGIGIFIKDFVKTIIAIVEACKGNKDALGELGTGWQVFGTIIYGIIQFIKGFIQTIMAVVEAAKGNTDALGELGIGWRIFGTIIYGVIAVIKSIVNFIKNLIKYLNGNEDALNNVGPGWKVLAVIIKGVITVIKSIIKNIKNIIKYLGGNKDSLDELGPGWKVLAVIIKTVITVVKSIINFIKNLIEYLKGNNDALDKLGPGWKVLAVIIKTVITVVKSIINFIKNLIQYLGGNKDALDEMGPGWKVLAVVIKAVITVIKACVKVIKTIIKVIKKIIEVVANVIKAFVDFAQGIRDGIQTAWGYITGFVSDVLDAFGNIVDSVFGIGKNIVEGLWNGIKSLTSWIAEKIKGFCSSALDAIKSFFGIASPSKVMRDVVGKNLVLGLAKGLDMYGGVAVKSSEKMSSKITKTISKGFNKGYNQAVKEVQKANKKVTDLQKKLQKTTDKNEKEKLKKQIEAAKKQRTKAKEALAQLQEDYISYCEDYLSRQQKLYTMSNKQVVQYWKDLLAKTKKGTTAYKEIQAKLIEAQEDYYAGLVDEADSALSKIQDLQDVSITDQITYWEKVKKKCLEGSTAYEDATHKIAVLQKELNDTMAELEDEFTKGLAEAVADVKSNIESIIDSYNDAVESAKDSMMGIAGLFEAFERDEGSAADTLMANLDTQIQGLEDFNAAIDKMYARGLPDDLIQSMQSLGPAALNNIEAILNMEDEMLEQYIAKWERKSSLAGEIANKQVDKQTYIDQIAEAVKEGQDAIQELVDDYNSGLAELGVTTFKTAESFQQDLVDQIANTFGISADALSNMIKSDMSDVGENTVDFITSGLLKNEKALTTVLNNLVTTDKLEINQSDYIEQGITVDEGLIKGLSNYEPRVYAEAYYVGQQMANGVQRGMQSRLNAIIAAAVSMVQQAIAAARAAAEVSSPSKAMRDQVGIWLPLGMAEGVKVAMPEAMGLIQDEIDSGLSSLEVATIDMSNILDMRDVAMVMLDVFDTIEKGMRDMTNEMVEDLEQVVDKTSGMLYNIDDVKGSMNTLIDANNVKSTSTSPNVSANVPVGSGSETVEQTFIFNSPKSIDEIQAARLLKQTSRDLAQGFA